MRSETIWSNSGSPNQSNGSNSQYRSVLDSVDPEVAKLFSGNNAGSVPLESRRFSFNDGSDIDSGIFGLKKGSFSAMTTPVGYNGGATHNAATSQRLPFGTASVSAGVANIHPPQDSFLQKFSTIADATREIELSNGLGNLRLEGTRSRRTSMNKDNGPKQFSDVGLLNTPPGSLNESLNINAVRTSRHQSISDKIDNYNNSSPIQPSAALSISSDLNSTTKETSSRPNAQSQSHNFWNPATATSFTPANSYNYFMDSTVLNSAGAPSQQVYPPYNRNLPNGPPISPPPFVMSSPPPQFIDPSLYNMINYNQIPDTEKDGEDDGTQGASEENGLENGKKGKKLGAGPSIGLMNRQMPSNSNFVFQNYNPYVVYQASPPVGMGNKANQDNSDNVNNADAANAYEANSASNHQTPPQVSASGPKRKGTKNASGGKGGAHIYRSPLLEEIRANSKGKEYYLKDIYGHAIEFTKDQHGSRFIQQKLPDASEEEKEVIFNEIRDISYELMTDVFGNYVIQKYFEHGSKTQKAVLLEGMINHIYELSLQMYGCRVVQRALEAIELDGQVKIIQELKDHVLVCAKDQNGNHVIQKSIEKIPFEKVKFILESLDNQIYHLSTHPYGCRVIQRLLEYSSPEDQKKILSELNRFIFYLIQDQYGNYVMQHILERGSNKDREEILNVVLGSVVNFSKHKFASNVIEKCIKHGTLEQRKKILQEVMVDNGNYEVELVDDNSPLALMMKDQYANYVIQKLVEGFDAKSEEKKLLVVKLRQYLKQISFKNNYGKHLASVEKMIVVAETALIEAENC